MTKLRLTLTTVLIAAAATAGCGRKNDPITPYEAAVEARREAEKAGEQPLPPQPQRPERDKRFILDGLID